MADTIATIRVRKRLVRIHRTRRMRKALDYVREAVAKLSKVDPKSVKIDARLNRLVMLETARRMNSLKVKISKEGDSVKVTLPEPEKKKAEQQVTSAKTAASADKKVQEKQKPGENKKAIEKKDQGPSKRSDNK